MKILVGNSHIHIEGYEGGSNRKIENAHTIFEPVMEFYETTPVFQYDEPSMTLKLPRGIISIGTLEDIYETKAIYLDDIVGAKAICKLNITPRELEQTEALDFLTNNGKFKSLTMRNRKMLEFDTGKGKTYCAICAICLMRMKAGIVLDTMGLIDQWLERISDFTNIDEREVFIVKGAGAIKKILDGKAKKHKIFLISHKTISSYAKKEGWDKVDYLFRKMDIGIKIIDEAHKEFLNTIKIDLNTNIKHTWYLTATAMRSSEAEDKIFSKIFGRIPALTLKRTKEEAFVQSAVVTFNSEPTGQDRSEITTMRGLSGVKYMNYLCTDKKARSLFLVTICTLVKTCLEKQEGKIAILVGTKAAVELVTKAIENNFSESVGMYTSDVSKADKLKNLKKRIIVTTFKSFGTGMDVDNLRYLIQCESYSSHLIINQCIGRLRAIGGTLMYFEVYDRGFNSRVKQFNKVKGEIMNRSIDGNITSFKIN